MSVLPDLTQSTVFQVQAGGAAAAAPGLRAPLRLRYFDCRGLAETTRYLLAIGGVKYEDERFPFTFGTPGDFTTVKRPEFDAAQEAGAFVAGMGKVPLLEVDGVPISQSKAIERYVARALGMAGVSELETAQMDAVAEHVRDIKQAYQPCRNIEDAAEKAAAMATWFDQTLPEFSRKLEVSLPSCVSHIHPDQINHAQVTLYAFYHGFFDNKEGALRAVADCPRISHICTVVHDHPAVQAWEQTRPETDF